MLHPPSTPPHPHPEPRPTAAASGEIPIFEQLSQEWAAAGRTLPGVPDLEWTRLSQFPVYQRASSDPRPGPTPLGGWFQDRHPA